MLKSHWQGITARGVKAGLTEDEIADSNKLARLIGWEAFEADGGEIRRDLFGDIARRAGPRRPRLLC